MLNLKTGIFAIAFSILAQVSNRLVSIVSLIVLARVLTPDDFGLVAIAMIFFNFAEVVSNTGGFGYLLSRKTIDDEMVYTNWTLTFLISLVLGLLLMLFSGVISSYYNDERLQLIIIILGALIAVRKLNSPGLVYKQKQQQLGAISTWQVVTKFISVGVTITIAVVFESYWALVIGHFISTLSYSLATYYIAPMMPKFSLSNVRNQWQFSKWLMPQSVVNFTRSQMDTIYVSGLFDKPIVGAYNSMRYYASLPNAMFLNTIFGPLLPQFAEFKDNADYYVKKLQVVVYILTVVCVPIIYLMNFHSTYVVELVLGNQWVQYSDLLGIFAFAIISMTITNFNRQIAMLHDKTNLLFYYYIFIICVQLLVFYFFEFDDVFVLAKTKVALDIATSLLFLIYLVVVNIHYSVIPTLFLPLFFPFVSLVFAIFLSSLIKIEVSGFLFLLIHSASFTLLFGLFGLCAAIIFRRKVYCYGYVVKILLKATTALRSLPAKS